jgi:carbamoyl-phosphate synthase large subunit
MMGYPVIVKPAVSTGGSRGVRIVTTREEMGQLAAELGDAIQHYILQEYVGTGDTEFTVGVLTDRQGGLIDSLVIQRKLAGLSLLENVTHDGRNYAISTGYSQGFIVDNSRIQELCERVALKLGSNGPLNIQLRTDGERVVVFEVHPRFSGTTPIRSDAGFNEPDVLLRNYLNGEKFGRLGYTRNLVALRAFEHVLVPFEKYEQMGGRPPRNEG